MGGCHHRLHLAGRVSRHIDPQSQFLPLRQGVAQSRDQRGALGQRHPVSKHPIAQRPGRGLPEEHRALGVGVEDGAVTAEQEGGRR